LLFASLQLLDDRGPAIIGGEAQSRAAHALVHPATIHTTTASVGSGAIADGHQHLSGYSSAQVAMPPARARGSSRGVLLLCDDEQQAIHLGLPRTCGCGGARLSIV